MRVEAAESVDGDTCLLGGTALLCLAGLAACDSSSDPATSPATSTAAAPTSAAGPPTSSVPPALPRTAVAAEEGGHLVVVDVTTGKVLRTLATFSDLRTPAPEGGHSSPRDVTLTPDGTVAYLEWCCEPAAGDIRRIPTAGGDGAGRASIDHGYAPSVSPDGASAAWGTYTSGITIRTGDQQRLVRGPDRPSDLSYTATAWVDDRRLAYVRSSPGGHVTDDQVYVHDLAAPDLLSDRLLAEVKDIRDLARRGDGSLVWVGSDGVGHVLDAGRRRSSSWAVTSPTSPTTPPAPGCCTRRGPASFGGRAAAGPGRSPGGSWPPAGEGAAGRLTGPSGCLLSLALVH